MHACVLVKASRETNVITFMLFALIYGMVGVTVIWISEAFGQLIHLFHFSKYTFLQLKKKCFFLFLFNNSIVANYVRL